MVHVSPKIEPGTVKSSLLAHLANIVGGMVVAETIRTALPVKIALTTMMLDARMGGVVGKKWDMMVAPTTKKHGTIAQIVIVRMVLVVAMRKPQGIQAIILPTHTRAIQEHAVVY